MLVWGILSSDAVFTWRPASPCQTKRCRLILPSPKSRRLAVLPPKFKYFNLSGTALPSRNQWHRATRYPRHVARLLPPSGAAELYYFNTNPSPEPGDIIRNVNTAWMANAGLGNLPFSGSMTEIILLNVFFTVCDNWTNTSSCALRILQCLTTLFHIFPNVLLTWSKWTILMLYFNKIQ